VFVVDAAVGDDGVDLAQGCNVGKVFAAKLGVVRQDDSATRCVDKCGLDASFFQVGSR
jgi:hypothetical protein